MQVDIERLQELTDLLACLAEQDRKIEAGAETPAATGKHDHPAVVIRSHGVERGVQSGDQRQVHGVELGRPVQRDLADRGVRRGDQHFGVDVSTRHWSRG